MARRSAKLAVTDGDWIWVSVPARGGWATFALVVRGGKVVGAAPYARWTIGNDERAVADYFRRRGAEFERLRNDGDD